MSIDREGYPKVTYELCNADKATLIRGISETARILAAAGATQVWTTHNVPVAAGDGSGPLAESHLVRFSETVEREGIRPNRTMLFSAHLMGSVRMSADPSQGPTSPTGELHSVKNLFIGDACVFPTTPAVNPMVTIMGVAMCTAESIITSLRPAA